MMNQSTKEDLINRALAFYHWALVDDAEDDPEHARGDEIDLLEELNYERKFIQEDEDAQD